MSDHCAIASELFQHVLETRRRRGELTTPALDEANRRRYAGVSVVTREAVIGSRSVGMDEATWDALRINRNLER